MPRKIIQDVIIKKKFSVKGGNVSLKETEFYKEKTGTKKEKADSVIIKEYKKPYFPAKVENPKEDYESDNSISKRTQTFIWIISIISLATLIFVISSIFASATVTITPKVQSINLEDAFFASNKKEIEGLHFQVLNIKKTLSQAVPTDGEEDVQRKAAGKVVLYNNSSASSQRLINNTRLESTDGRIYRIQNSVEIPGIKTINGVKTPGSIEADVVADDAGPSFNMNLSDLKGDFKIPGFKGSSKYTLFYGRLSSDITGGFIGKVKKVSEEKLAIARSELKTNLSNELLKNVYEKLPSQFVLFKNDSYMNMTDLPDTSDKDDYGINESGEINAIIFDKKELSQFLAINELKNFNGASVDTRFADTFTASISGQTEKPWNENSIKVKFSGKTDFIWQYDKDSILNQIKGQNKTIISAILEKNKNSIDEISSTIMPAWKKSFPTSLKKIEIVDTVSSSTK